MAGAASARAAGQEVVVAVAHRGADSEVGVAAAEAVASVAVAAETFLGPAVSHEAAAVAVEEVVSAGEDGDLVWVSPDLLPSSSAFSYYFCMWIIQNISRLGDVIGVQEKGKGCRSVYSNVTDKLDALRLDEVGNGLRKSMKISP